MAVGFFESVHQQRDERPHRAEQRFDMGIIGRQVGENVQRVLSQLVALFVAVAGTMEEIIALNHLE